MSGNKECCRIQVTGCRRSYFTSGLTLLEMLVTLALVVGMMSLALPGWHALEERMMRHAATGVMLRGLEAARVTAITQRANTWIILQHRDSLNGSDRFCSVQEEEGKFQTITPWINLPNGVSFLIMPGTIMSQQAPESLYRGLQQLSPQEIFLENNVMGYLQWNAQGSITYPAAGSIPLVLALSTSSGKIIDEIGFSRLTGRANILLIGKNNEVSP